MEELIEYKGEWFSPVHKGIKLSGILSINKKENIIKLSIFSDKDITGINIFERKNRVTNFCKIILGVTSNGDHITLYNHSGNENGAPILEYPISNNFYESVYRPNYAFVGKHFNSFEAIKFKSYSFRYNFLDSWIDTTRSFFKTKEFSIKETIITVPSIQETKFQVGENCSVSITRDLYSTGGNLSRNFNLEIRHYVSFSFDNPVSLYIYLNLSATLKAFLTFAIGFPISTIDEFSDTENSDRWHEDGSLEIFQNISNLEIDNRVLFSHNMFFCSQDTTQKVLIQYLTQWFQTYEYYHSAIDIFLHAVSPFWKKGSTTVTNVQFTNGLLNICQAIETFFNRDNKIEYSQTKEQLNKLKQKGYDKIRKNKKILNFTDEELDYYNTYFKVPKNKEDVDYKHKIIYYLNKLKEALKGFIDENEFEEFAKKLKDCRNTLTHVNYNRNINDTYDLPYLFYHSQILFYSMTLDLIGMEHSEINNVLTRSNKFNRYYKCSQ